MAPARLDRRAPATFVVRIAWLSDPPQKPENRFRHFGENSPSLQLAKAVSATEARNLHHAKKHEQCFVPDPTARRGRRQRVVGRGGRGGRCSDTIIPSNNPWRSWRSGIQRVDFIAVFVAVELG
jgi:hypothetical protein